MKYFFSLCLLSGALALPLLGQSSDTYINNGVTACATNSPQIDSRVFINNGSFCVFSPDPYDFSNAQIFTNRGVLSGSVGFRFDHAPSSGIRGPAQIFVNDRTGSINVSDSTAGFFFSGVGVGAGFSLFPPVSYVMANADTIINRGSISIGPSGLVQLLGQNVVLTNGTIVVQPIGSANGGFFNGFFSPGGFFGCDPDYSFSISPTNFFPDVGLYDVYWGNDIRTNFFLPQLLQGSPPQFLVSSPNDVVTNGVGNGGFRTSVSLVSPASWVFSSSSSPTNAAIQAVFVQTIDTNISVDVKLINRVFPSGNTSSGDLLTAVVQLSSLATNLITGDKFTNMVYFIDQLGSDTNFTSITNLVADTLRPAPYILSRTPPCDYLLAGITSNSVVDSAMFYNSGYSNRTVTNIYASYSGEVDNLASRLPAIPGVSITNRPGRVEIFANNLDMTRARIRGEGIVSIKATNLIGSTNAVVDVQSLNYNLSATDHTLKVQNLVRDSVQRFSGPITAWSGAWTNQFVDPVTTNVTQVAFHTLLLDASFMSSVQRVLVNDFSLSSQASPASVVVSDNVSVGGTFSINAENLTVDGSIGLNSPLSWDATTVTRLRNLTNNGVITSVGLINLGQDAAVPYANIINHGTLNAFSYLINSDYFQNSGSISAIDTVNASPNFFITNVVTRSVGPINIQAQTAKLDGGTLGTGGDVTLSANVIKFNSHTVDADGGLNITGTGAVQDSGPDAKNIWRLGNGVHIASPKPAGDLLGTSFESTATRFGVVQTDWPAENRGAISAGFTNNLALGHMILSGQQQSVFVFSGNGANNAMYVDLLELGGSIISDLTNSISLDNIDLYFADVKSSDPKVPISVEELDGRQFGNGTLHWVSSFAGPNSSVAVPLGPNGPTIRVNRALRNSASIDSNGNGIANRDDEFPFSIVLRNVSLPRNSSNLSFAWATLPGASYVVEYATNLTSPNWIALPSSQISSSNGTAQFQDQVSRGQSQRYYRIRYTSF